MGGWIAGWIDGWMDGYREWLKKYIYRKQTHTNINILVLFNFLID